MWCCCHVCLVDTAFCSSESAAIQIPVPIQLKLMISLQCPVKETLSTNNFTSEPQPGLWPVSQLCPGCCFPSYKRVMMIKDKRMQRSTLSVILILIAMWCKELILLLLTFISVQTPAIQELWCYGWKPSLSFDTSKLFINCKNAFIDEDECSRWSS